MTEKSLIVDQSPATAVASVSSSGKELQNKVDRLSNLNPNAKEFIPVAAHQLSTVAPSIGDGSSSGSRRSHRVSGSTFSSVSSSGKELQNKVNMFSNLNPNAKEFIPVAAHQLSTVAPSIGDGSSSNSRTSHRVSGSTFSSVSSSGKELQNKVDRLSNLNPIAKEFIPVAAHQLSTVAPSIGDGSSSSSRTSHRMNAVGQNESKIRRTIYIPEVPEDVTEWDLAMHFKLCGIIKECRICGNIKSPLRLAFIEFSNESEARLALSLSGKHMLGYSNEAFLKILPSKTAIHPVNRRFLPKSNYEMERVYRTIYCTNIDNGVPETQLVNFFEIFCGEVTEFRILYDDKYSTWIAFIEFSQWEAATSALRYSGTLMGNIPIRISPSKTAVKHVPYHQR